MNAEERKQMTADEWRKYLAPRKGETTDELLRDFEAAETGEGL